MRKLFIILILSYIIIGCSKQAKKSDIQIINIKVLTMEIKNSSYVQNFLLFEVTNKSDYPLNRLLVTWSIDDNCGNNYIETCEIENIQGNRSYVITNILYNITNSIIGVHYDIGDNHLVFL